MYRRRNERYADRFGGGGSVMIWAAIVHGYRSPLVVIDGNLNAQRYRDDILAHHVIPFLFFLFIKCIMPPVIQVETL